MSTNNIRIFRAIEQVHRMKLVRTMPVVVRFDGKNVTKNHKDYHLMNYSEFTEIILKAAQVVSKGCECTIYAALDEVSVVFHKPAEFFSRTEDCDLLYSAVIVLQMFRDITLRELPQTKFNVSVFNIQYSQIRKYVDYRKSYAMNTAVTYYAKEYLKKIDYVGKTRAEMIVVLKQNGFDVYAKELRWFFNGIEKNSKSANSPTIPDGF